MMGAGGAIYEPRYIIPFYFATLIFAARGIKFVSNLIKPHSKYFALIFIIVMVALISLPQANRSYQLVESKKMSYQGIKQAGVWLSQNSDPNDVILTFEGPQMTYYSKRRVVGIKPQLERVISDLKNEQPNYMVLWAGAGQQRLAELTTLIQSTNGSINPVAGFPAGSQQPLVVLYEISPALYTQEKFKPEQSTTQEDYQDEVNFEIDDSFLDG